MSFSVKVNSGLRNLARTSFLFNKSRYAYSVSTIQQNQKLYEPIQYNGISEKPSMIMQNCMVDTTIWDEIPVVDNDIFVCTPGNIYYIQTILSSHF